jgi:uncharacterized alkaline shock family protein YloU
MEHQGAAQVPPPPAGHAPSASSTTPAPAPGGMHPAVVAQTPAAPAAAPTAATGTTSISDTAVAKVAAAAARTVSGVHSLGAGSNRALGALRGAVAGGPDPAPGVAAEVGTTQVAVDLVLTATYGRPLHDIAADVRAAVYTAVERLTGLQVIEVNVEIGDVHLPGLPDRAAAAPVAGGASAAEPVSEVQAPAHRSQP